MSSDFECSLGFNLFKNDDTTTLSRIVSSTATSILFSLIPAVLCVYYYYQSVQVLFSCKKKVGRNLNLIFCFATICVIWWLIYLARYAFVGYSLVVSLKAPLRKVYQYPVARNLYMDFILSNFSSFSSLFNPFLILLAQTDYRKPFLKRKEKLLKKLWNLAKSEESANAENRA